MIYNTLRTTDLKNKRSLCLNVPCFFSEIEMRQRVEILMEDKYPIIPFSRWIFYIEQFGTPTDPTHVQDFTRRTKELVFMPHIEQL